MRYKSVLVGLAGSDRVGSGRAGPVEARQPHFFVDSCCVGPINMIYVEISVEINTFCQVV